MEKNGRIYALSGLILLAVLIYSFRPADVNVQIDQAESVVATLLKSKGVDPAKGLEGEEREQRSMGRFRWRSLEQRFRVPSSFALDGFRKALERELKGRRLILQKVSLTRQGSVRSLRLEVGSASARQLGSLYRVSLEQREVPAAAQPISPLFPKGRGKIAIVLDDWGYNVRNLPLLSSIRRPLTISILPNLPHSAEVAKAAKDYGHEVILHMPMEANDPRAPREAGTLLTTMPRQEVVELLTRSLATVPSAKGISNHQGSKATSDPALMQVILSEVKQRRLYFLDSFVTQQSVCRGLARQLRIPFAQRAVFLDNEENAPAIRQQLTELARIANKQGHAIGIGHDRPVTVLLLQQEIPSLEVAGYTIVPVSELTDASSGD